MELNNVSQFSQTLRQHQERMYKLTPTPTQKNNSEESDFRESLLRRLDRIEAKLDILLMQRGK